LISAVIRPAINPVMGLVVAAAVGTAAALTADAVGAATVAAEARIVVVVARRDTAMPWLAATLRAVGPMAEVDPARGELVSVTAAAALTAPPWPAPTVPAWLAATMLLEVGRTVAAEWGCAVVVAPASLEPMAPALAAEATLEPPAAVEPLLAVTEGSVVVDGLLAEDLGDEATPPPWPYTEESPAPVVSAWATPDPLARTAPTPRVIAPAPNQA
jgi:hypothetical protein